MSTTSLDRGTDPGRPSTTDLAEGLRMIAHRLAYALRRPDPASDISPTGYTTLSTLSKHEAMRPGDLAATIGVSRASMSRIEAALLEGGWVTSEPDPADGRAHLLRISEHGVDVLTELRRDASRDLRAGLESLSPDDLRRVADAVPVLVGLADEMMARLGDR